MSGFLLAMWWSLLAVSIGICLWMPSELPYSGLAFIDSIAAMVSWVFICEECGK